MSRQGIAAKAFGLKTRRNGVAQGMRAKPLNPFPSKGQEIDPGFSPDWDSPIRSHQAHESSGQNAHAFARAMQAAPPGIAGNENATLGRQLNARVQSGAIDQDQAQQTARERQMLEENYGPDWRTKVYGGAGIVRANRKALQGPGEHPQAEAFRQKLMEDRKRALERIARGLGQ